MYDINCIHLNQDCSCFCVAHAHGFSVYNSDPIEQLVCRDFGGDSGIAVASVLDRTNYMVLVGTGTRFSKSEVLLWNDQAQDVSTIKYDSQVINALIGRQVIVAVRHKIVHITSLASPHSELIHIETYSNPLGIAAMYNDTLVVPARNRGQIAVLDTTKPQIVSVISCHRSPIAAIAVNDTYIATASATGTLIRVQDRKTGVTRYFRRGLDRARVYSLAISPACTKLAALSDKQTLHIFDLTTAATNEKHALAGLPFAPKRYFQDEWSSARVKTRSKEPGICGWTNNSDLIVLRSSQAQWEKYIVKGSSVIADTWHTIH